MKDKIILPKGESINFLDYIIKNSGNNDGLVLLKDNKKMMSYECHLGNFGTGTKENIDLCKLYAIRHFMLRRPETFAGSLVNKLAKQGSGTYHEFFLFKNCLKAEGIPMPEEITDTDGINFMIGFNGKTV